jgi:predicted metal-binding membrane protein
MSSCGERSKSVEYNTISGDALWRDGAWTVWLASGAVFAATVWYTIYSCREMAGGMQMPGGWMMSMMWMPMAGQSMWGFAWMFIAMWTAMMIAMMLPSAMPMILLYRRAILFRGESLAGLRSAVMIAGYFLVWAAFGLVTFVLGFLIAKAEMSSDLLSRAVPIIGGAMLIACGIYQWTPWKSSCLKCCQDPMSLVAGHLPSGFQGSLRLGLHHGMKCAICCSSLMVIQIVLGMMNLVVMAGVALVIAIEKLLPRGQAAAKIVGVLAVIAGIASLLRGGLRF